MSGFRAWQADLFLLVNTLAQRFTLYTYSNSIQRAMARKLVAVY